MKYTTRLDSHLQRIYPRRLRPKPVFDGVNYSYMILALDLCIVCKFAVNLLPFKKPKIPCLLNKRNIKVQCGVMQALSRGLINYHSIHQIIIRCVCWLCLIDK